jgi:uncharacterized protein (DUF305 family)
LSLLVRFLLLAVATSLAAAGCGGSSGGDGHPPEHQQGGASRPKPEQAFLQAMVPHHESAIDMARVAEREGESSFVKDLGGSITSDQEEEIDQMRKIHERLYRSPLRPDEGAHEALGLSAEEAGMNHMDGGAMLRGKRPFDRAFIDEMVPHHEGAIAMADAVLEETLDPELRKLAEGLVRTQEKEISEMKDFRKREYGTAPPKESAPSAHGEHGG